MGQWGHWQETSELSVNSEICNPNKSATDIVGGRKSRKQFCTLFHVVPVYIREKSSVSDCIHKQAEIYMDIHEQVSACMSV